MFYQRFWQTISSGIAWRGRFMNIKKEGSRFTQEGSVTPVLDSNNQIVNYVAVMLDISEEIRKDIDAAIRKVLKKNRG